MSDKAIEAAKSKREQLLNGRKMLKTQLQEIDRELADTENFILKWHQFAGEEIGENENIVITSDERHTGPSPVLGAPRRKATGNSKKEDVAAEARRIIDERGEPVPRTDLYRELVARDYTIEGSDPEMVLSTMLWRAGKAAGVIRLKKGGGYWKAEEDWPDSGYLPNLDINL